MNCERCGEQIPPGDDMDHFGRILCEDCYLRVLSPARACDPWAVRSAQKLSQMDTAYAGLSEMQDNILQILRETGGMEAHILAETLHMKLSALEMELATLRHMEKVRGQMRAGKKTVCLWEM